MPDTGISFLESAYDQISTIYEDAFRAHYQHVQRVLDGITKDLSPKSRVLDIGSGTGRPVTDHFASHGHIVTGVDISLGMVDLARKQVPKAQFIHSPMTMFEPPAGEKYDVVIASHSLYHIPLAQIRSMILKFALWTKPGGIVVIGSSYRRQLLESHGYRFDSRGWAEGVSQDFLGHMFDGMTYGLETAWSGLLEQAGLQIVEIDRGEFTRDHEQHIDEPDRQFYFLARRGANNPLFGPYPLPENGEQPIESLGQGDTDAWTQLYTRLLPEHEVQAAISVFQATTAKQKILCVGAGTKAFSRSFRESFSDVELFGLELTDSTETFDTLPSTGFTNLILLWTQQLKLTPENILQETLPHLALGNDSRICIILPAPDNEALNIIREAAFNLSINMVHHGLLLKGTEEKLRSVGFNNIKYLERQGILSFEDVKEPERVSIAASLLFRVTSKDPEVTKELERRLAESLKNRFLYNASGEIMNQFVLLIANRAP